MKKLVSLILALAVALSLTGAAFAEEPVTITYATFSASGAQEETLKKMVEVFEEKNPDIKVDVQLTGYDDYFTKLATTVGGGNAPDVFEMNMENFLAYMLRGACADLTGLVDPASYSEGTLSAVSSDGKLYAVPMSFSTCVLFYNKALFDQAGIDYPDDTWTWTEAQAAAEKIRALGDDIWGYYQPISYNEFYKSKFMDYTDPLRVITSRTEGTATYTALLFIPGSTPYDYYTKEYEKGLALYASGVMIMEKCGDLLPDYFSFVKGVVDSEDLSLNISRETLQKDNQLKLMRNSLEKKIKNELHAMLVNDREKYETFWKSFGRQIKFGIYGDYGMHKDLLGDLLMFYSAKEKKLVTLDEYIEKMPEDQKFIYFAAGDDTDRLSKLPNAQLVLSKGYDLLLCTEDVDEFCLQVMHEYKEKTFQNINAGDLGLETEDEKKAAEAAETENKDLFEEIKKDLNGKVKEVKVNPTLQEHPVTLTAEGGISMEMEKVLRRMPNAEGVESTKVLELNPNHTVFAALKAAHAAGDADKVAKYAELLYDQALLIAGLPIEDPVAYAQLVCGLMQ